MEHEGKEMKGTPQAIDVPAISCSSFKMFGTAAELGLLVSSTMPALDEDEQMGLAFAPQAFLRMPPVAAKELMVLLGNYIKQVENDVGELKSEFLASQASSD